MDILINAGRAILAVLIIGVLPGYMLIYFLFARSQLDVLEQFYLTVLSSLAITSLIAFTLSRRESGLTAQGLIFAISLFVAFCLFCVLISRIVAGKPEISDQMPDHPSQSIWLLLGMSLLMIISAVIGLSTTQQSLGLTEFYITAEQLSPQGVQYSVVNDSLVVPIAITNRQGEQIIYHVEGWVAEEKVSTQDQIVVNDGETWNGQLSVPLKSITHTDSVTIQLFRKPVSQLVAELQIWLPVESVQ